MSPPRNRFSLQLSHQADWALKNWLRVCFFGKIQNPDKGFCVFLGKSKNGSWIHKIHIQGGFFGSNANLDFWDSQSEWFFLGKDLKKVFLTSGFPKKKRMVCNRCGTCMTSNGTYVGDALLILSHYLHIIPCLSSIQIIDRLFLNPYLSCFLYVCSVCLCWFIFQVIKKKKTIHQLQF